MFHLWLVSLKIVFLVFFFCGTHAFKMGIVSEVSTGFELKCWLSRQSQCEIVGFGVDRPKHHKSIQYHSGVITRHFCGRFAAFHLRFVVPKNVSSEPTLDPRFARCPWQFTIAQPANDYDRFCYYAGCRLTCFELWSHLSTALCRMSHQDYSTQHERSCCFVPYHWLSYRYSVMYNVM